MGKTKLILSELCTLLLLKLNFAKNGDLHFIS